MKQLLITADDYGVHNVIDNGIRKAIDSGGVNCVDAIVTHHTSSKRIHALMRDYENLIRDGKLAIGLHLSITCGTPQYREDDEYIRKLAVRRRHNGRLEFRHATAQSVVPRIDKMLRDHKEALLNEMYAQFDRFEEITGFKPKHVSSHIGFYTAKPPLFHELVSHCSQEDIWLRCPTLLGLNQKAELSHWLDDPEQKLLPKLIKVLPNGSEIWNWVQDDVPGHFETAVSNGLTSSDHFIEHMYKQGSKQTFDTLLGKTRQHRYEMVVHPVWFSNKNQYASMPNGVKKKPMHQRKIECETLCQFGNRDGFDQYLKDNFNINRLDIG